MTPAALRASHQFDGALGMDIFGGVISGANYGGDVGDQYKVYDRPQDVGHFFLAMKTRRSAAGPAFPTPQARSKPCRTKPGAPASNRW